MTVAELMDHLANVPSHYDVKVWTSGSLWGEATVNPDLWTVLLED